ncbi:DUF3373 family protein [Desulfobacterales bacterium HSG17]|nr:DUF3373 family protein [Desulfobacterales bacterium HSG17]
MIRYILVLMITAIFCFQIVNAGAETISIEKDLLEKILKRQDELEKKIETLQQKLNTRDSEKSKTLDVDIKPDSDISPDSGITEDVKYLKSDVEEISDRLDKVETKSILDKIQIGGEFRTQVNFLNFDDIKADGQNFSSQKEDANIDELWWTRLRLNLRSNITKDLIFHGRLSYLKYWGTTNYENDTWDARFFMTPEQEGNLHVERAYIDYFIPETPLSFTLGRLPTSNAPPYEFKNYTTRKATWAQLFVDGEFDGIMGNLSLEKWTGLKNSMTRLAYVKVSQNYSQYQALDLDSARVIGANFDMEIPGVNDSLFWLGYYKVFDLTPLKVEGAVSPEDSGEADTYTIHVQFDNLMDSGLGWFASFAYQNIQPSSQGTVLAPGYEVGLVGDSLHGDLGETQEGYSFYTGLKYILPIESLKYPNIGFEYNYGSQYWLPLSTHTSGEFTNKLGVNGSAYELYYIQPIIKNNMFCRLGAVYQDYKYFPLMYLYGSRDGQETESNMSVLHTYFLVDVRF